MKDELEPLEDSESILRRVHKSYIHFDQPISVDPVAFRPSSQDDDGISIVRESCISDPAEILKKLSPEKQQDYYVVRVAVRAIKALGLSIVSTPDPDDVPGHSIIPELSLSGYKKNKSRMKDVQLELAKLASTAIVHRPA
jgi:hypothetical protein